MAEKCKIATEISERLLFVKTHKESWDNAQELETHYKTCTNEQCVKVLGMLKEMDLLNESFEHYEKHQIVLEAQEAETNA